MEGIARHFLQHLSAEDIEYLSHGQDHFGMAKRHIRNAYLLWENNPLTLRWRELPEERMIIDGIDHSSDHPDNISATIFARVVELLNENLSQTVRAI